MAPSDPGDPATLPTLTAMAIAMATCGQHKVGHIPRGEGKAIYFVFVKLA